MAFIIIGILAGLGILSIAYIIMEEQEYKILKIVDIMFSLIFLCDIIIIPLVFIGELMEDGCFAPDEFYIGVYIGVIISAIQLIYLLFCTQGKYIRMKHKIKKIESNIEQIKENNLSPNQHQIIKLLQETKNKLIEQSYNILIMDSIKVAKNIELSNKGIDIQRELDELEALQILNKG